MPELQLTCWLLMVGSSTHAITAPGKPPAMLFTSPEFFVLLVITLGLYYALPFVSPTRNTPRPSNPWTAALHHQLQPTGLQNMMLLVASYIFYGWWDWRFLFLLFFSTALDFGVGQWLYRAKSERVRYGLIVGSITLQIGLLGFFKYFNFFVDSAATAFSKLGFQVEPWTLQIVLPVGISFYTFHTISYTVDIYRRLTKPTNDFIAFALFISFYPQLVAGPIARASHLLPQMCAPRRPTLKNWYEGGYFFLWGLFKKVAVADNLAPIVDRAFSNADTLNSWSALVGVYAFAWQIYCDFSGYTDMARGVSKWFGVDLQINFDVPYLAVDPSDFWQRWHISLSTWLRDYLYIPMGGSRLGVSRTYINLMLTMLIGGLWHGANWTYVLWGLYQGLLLVGYRLVAPNLAMRPMSAVVRIANQIWFFHLVCLGWVFFRAENFAQMTNYLSAFGRRPIVEFGDASRLLLAAPVFFLELFIDRWKDQGAFFRFPWFVRAAGYVGMYCGVMVLGKWGSESFIYFQF